jgi:hypothetical protein
VCVLEHTSPVRRDGGEGRRVLEGKQKGRSPEKERSLCAKDYSDNLLLILLLALPSRSEEEPVRAEQDRDEEDHDYGKLQVLRTFR